jgi:hypothetical protein
MSLRGFLLAICAVLSVFLLFGVVSGVFVEGGWDVSASTELEAGAVITEAEEKIVICYRAVADADKVGANITGLLVVLNNAGDLLSRAKLAYKLGDYDDTVSLAVQGQEQLSSFVEEADVLRGAAIQKHYWDFLVNVVGPIMGTVAVVCGGFVVWVVSKRRYSQAGSVGL